MDSNIDQNKKKITAVSLVSGGLDSVLATTFMKQQGIDIIALNFKTPFCLCDRKASWGCGSNAAYLSDNLGIKLKIISAGNEFLEILKNPQHGYGSNMNPCIDCRIMMFKKAKQFMSECGADFIITGEVIGQRPMSQHRQAINTIEQASGLEGLVLRPLSAKHFKETIPEKQGWVSRDKLLDFNGRSRRPQISLACELGVKDYPCPAGGCLLTDPKFSDRIRDLIKYNELSIENVNLLKVGRHFRLSRNFKLVVGRDERENQRIKSYLKQGDHLFFPDEIAGPTALGRGESGSELRGLALSIVAHYCDTNGDKTARIICSNDESESQAFIALACDDSCLQGLRI